MYLKSQTLLILILGYSKAKPFFSDFDFMDEYGGYFDDSEHSHISVVDRIQLALTTLETQLVEAILKSDETVPTILIESGMLSNRSATVVNNTPPKVQLTISNIWNYGCWCYLDNNWGQGRGVPVNEVDSVCKILHDGYDCILHDHKVEYPGERCDPWTVDYLPAVKLGRKPEEVETECKKHNNEICAQRTCIIESHFILSFFNLAISKDHVFEPFYKHDKGFNPDLEGNCPRVEGRKSEKSCCGIYPVRYPFKTLNGQRQCCKRQTFDVNLRECCNDAVTGLGTCLQ